MLGAVEKGREDRRQNEEVQRDVNKGKEKKGDEGMWESKSAEGYSLGGW